MCVCMYVYEETEGKFITRAPTFFFCCSAALAAGLCDCALFCVRLFGKFAFSSASRAARAGLSGRCHFSGTRRFC